jgi:hypothetical protein
MATKKKVTKKSVKPTAKKATKKVLKPKAAKAAKVVKAKASAPNPLKYCKANAKNPNPYYRYTNFSLMEYGNESFPDMIIINAGPAWGRELFGRKYVNLEFACKAVDALHGEQIISKGAKLVTKEMLAAGVAPLDNSDIDIED